MKARLVIKYINSSIWIYLTLKPSDTNYSLLFISVSFYSNREIFSIYIRDVFPDTKNFLDSKLFNKEYTDFMVNELNKLVNECKEKLKQVNEKNLNIVLKIIFETIDAVIEKLRSLLYLYQEVRSVFQLYSIYII